MTPKTYFNLTTLSCSVFGLSYILLSPLVASLHGANSISSFALLTMRLYGGGLLATALMAWSVRDSSSSIGRKSIFLFLFVLDLSNTLLNVSYMIQEGAQLINWLELAITVSFGLGAFYFWNKE